MNNAPSQFSAQNPSLQIAWDATSLGALQFCPRYYQYSIVEGWQSTAQHTDFRFGGLFASAVEAYYKARLVGETKLEATKVALRYVIDNGGEEVGGDWYPFNGSYDASWRCEGTEPFKNEKGNKAVCPYAHKGKWQWGMGPSTCPRCDSATVQEVRWTPTDPVKNRNTLVRAVGWYCDDQPELLTDEGMQPYAFPDGHPAVELSFRVPIERKAPTGEPYILVGYLDRIARLDEEYFVVDNKTTKKSIDAGYFSQFSPSIQMDTYDVCASVAFPSLQFSGVLIDAAQTLVGGAKFGLGVLRRTETQREEYLTDLGYWLGQAEYFASEGHWPMNRKNCSFCSFRGVCSLPPLQRPALLDANFVKQRWNPLEER